MANQKHKSPARKIGIVVFSLGFAWITFGALFQPALHRALVVKQLEPIGQHGKETYTKDEVADVIRTYYADNMRHAPWTLTPGLLMLIGFALYARSRGRLQSQPQA